MPLTGGVANSQISLTLISLGLSIGYDRGHRPSARTGVEGGSLRPQEPRGIAENFLKFQMQNITFWSVSSTL